MTPRLLGLVSSIESVTGGACEITVLTTRDFELGEELEQFGIGCPVRHRSIGRHARSLPERVMLKVRRMLAPVAVDRATLRRAMKGMDVLLVGGGNLIMDLFEAWPPILRAVCRQARASRVPYAFVGIGAGPLSGGAGQTMLAECLANARANCYRDAASRDLVAARTGLTGRLMPDLALALDPGGMQSEPVRDRISVNVANLYGSTWPYRDEARNVRYLQSYARLVASVARAEQIDGVTVFATNATADAPALDKLCELLETEHGLVPMEVLRAPSVSEVIECNRRARIAICTRLHAGILAAHGGAELRMVNYQPKVADVLRSTGIAFRFCEVDDLLEQEEEPAFQQVDGVAAADFEPHRREIDAVLRELLPVGE